MKTASAQRASRARLYGPTEHSLRHDHQETRSIVIRNLTIEVERSGSWRDVTPLKPRRLRPKGEPPLRTRPIRGTLTGGAFIARAHAFPLVDASVRSIDCCDVLEFVRDEDLLLDEIARVLAPGGTLRLRVPAAGPLAAFDAYNLMHYLVDTTHRGARPHEVSELGWRRHYRLADLESLLGADRFRINRVMRRRLAVAEFVTFAGMVAFRWVRPQRDWYRKVKRLASTIERVEHHVKTPFGAVIEIEATRLRE
jgi:SAM-dependent methyltransferase